MAGDLAGCIGGAATHQRAISEYGRNYFAGDSNMLTDSLVINL